VTETIEDGEIVGEEIALREEATPTLFHTNDPVQVLERATAVAVPLAEVVRKQGLVTNIKGREHVRVEGWTLLGSMLGVFPVCVWTRELDKGWEARVEARTRDGAVVGAAEAMCTTDEGTWKNRDSYALRSMAQTRATSKALRQPLGFVMQLAGFEATPAEEMPSGAAESHAEAIREPAPPPEPDPKAEARKAASRLQRMRVKIEKLCQDADKGRNDQRIERAVKAGEEPQLLPPGTTWNELLRVITWRHDLPDDPDALAAGEAGDYGADWETLSEPGVEWLGKELKDYIDSGAAMGTFFDHCTVRF